MRVLKPFLSCMPFIILLLGLSSFSLWAANEESHGDEEKIIKKPWKRVRKVGVCLRMEI